MPVSTVAGILTRIGIGRLGRDDELKSAADVMGAGPEG
jgi:hypothetical protein